MAEQLNLVRIDEAKDFTKLYIKDAFETGEKCENIMIHGSPGVGKSSIIEQIRVELSEEMGIKIRMVDLRVASSASSDMKGIPHVVESVMRHSTPEWWPVDDDEYVIIFLDELTNAISAQQHAAYQLVLDRSIQNGKKMSNRVVVIGAGNLKSDKTGAKPLLPALANRFDAHLTIDVKRIAEPVLNYFVQKRVHRDIVGYLSAKRESIYQPPKLGEDAFPTGRSWESVNKHLKKEGRISDEILLSAIAGAVGTEKAIDFAAYRQYKGQLPDWKRIRSGDPEYNYAIPKTDDMLQYSLGTSLAFELLDALEQDLSDETDRLTEMVKEMKVELQIVVFKTMKRDKAVMLKLFKHKSLHAEFKKVSPMIV